MEDKYRKGNIELHKIKHWLKDDSDKDTFYWEIVKWMPNVYYGREKEFIWNNTRKMYCYPENEHCFIDKSCFKNKETCFTVAIFKEHNEDEPDMYTVGSRFPISLNDEEIKDFIDVSKEFWNIYNTESDEEKGQ